MDKIQGNQQALNDAERRGDVYQKDGYYHVRTIATAIEKKQGSSMALHGGQANITKDELFADEHAPVKLSRASAPRSDWAEIVKDRLSKSLTRKTKNSIIL